MTGFGRLLFEIAAEILAPTRCAACDEDVVPAVLFCDGCRASADAWPDASAGFAYGGAVATAIALLKYRGRPDLGPRLGAALAAHAGARLAGHADVVVPVPLHPRRLAERGFNQAGLLAGEVAKRLGIAYAPRALERIRDTPRQADLDRRGRAANVEGAFACAAPRAIAARRVLLVDDVRTTGATLSAAKASLRASGARDVLFLTFAAKDRDA
jgi:ComF family protein